MGENIDLLVKEICKLPTETSWLELKENNCDPMMIGADISALANSATLLDHDCAYMIWGVEDGSHNIIGITVIDSQRRRKVAKNSKFG